MNDPQGKPGAVEWPRWLALFAGSVTVRVVTGSLLWAYNQGAVGPRDRGLRVMATLPIQLLRLVRGVATLGAVFSGGTLLFEGRRRWLEHLERIRVLAPLPQNRS